MPAATIIVLTAIVLMTLLLPLGVMLALRRRGGTWTAFLTGAGTFVLFAMVLEPILHNLILRSPAGAAIRQNILLYALYGGLAAGLFEETGRLLAFRFILKPHTARITALSYGIGHGGIEAFLVMGLSMIANLSLGLAYTSGAPLPAEAAAAAETILSTPAGMFLWGGLERLSAMALHMAPRSGPAGGCCSPPPSPSTPGSTSPPWSPTPTFPSPLRRPSCCCSLPWPASGRRGSMKICGKMQKPLDLPPAGRYKIGGEKRWYP